ncbi:ATP-dependent helicase [Candidatus Riflebacteria bacterium]
MDEILSGLNEEQLEAVLSTEGPLLILAGAGSGKTRVITHRIAYILWYNQAIQPFNILGVTFTNKAAAEMRGRVQHLLSSVVGRNPYGLAISTFHSLGVQILKRFTGFEFSILDETDQKALIRECISLLKLDKKKYKVNPVRERISNLKNELKPNIALLDDGLPALGDIFRLYEEKLNKSRLFDFDDLILKSLRLLQENEIARFFFQQRFKYILIDEFQDTNLLQYELIRILAGEKNKNLCVVGDEDQSIYSWRGANIQNILGFIRDYPEATKIVLCQNYRSTLPILAAAGYIIENNKSSTGKILKSVKGGGSPVSIRKLPTDSDEVRYIVEEINRLRRLEGRPFSDFAVFFRMHALSRKLENTLNLFGLKENYRIYGGLKFYERKEIKDMLAYFRLLNNPDDEVSFLRVANVPGRGIGKTTLSKISSQMEEKSISLSKVLAELDFLPKRAAQKIREFVSLIKRIKSECKHKPLYQILKIVLLKTKYREFLQDNYSEEAREKKFNIDALGTELFERMELNPDTTLSQFLDDVSLFQDTDDDLNQEKERDCINLMTLHNAKGLEFPVVFIMGMEEGIFPHSRSFTSIEELEEERRLAYVGMTRAEDKLYFTYSSLRTIWGSVQSAVRSRFVDELQQKLRAGEGLRQQIYGTKRAKPEISRDTVEEINFQVGQRVLHQKFQEGVVLEIRKTADDLLLTIRFEVGKKNLLASYARLQTLPD